jgi:hypothetical protein
VTATPVGIPLTLVLLAEVPVALVAVAAKKYVVPLVKPVITQLVAGETTEQVLDNVAEPVDDTAVTLACPLVTYVKVVEEGTEATV